MLKKHQLIYHVICLLFGLKSYLKAVNRYQLTLFHMQFTQEMPLQKNDDRIEYLIFIIIPIFFSIEIYCDGFCGMFM